MCDGFASLDLRAWQLVVAALANAEEEKEAKGLHGALTPPLRP